MRHTADERCDKAARSLKDSFSLQARKQPEQGKVYFHFPIQAGISNRDRDAGSRTSMQVRMYLYMYVQVYECMF